MCENIFSGFRHFEHLILHDVIYTDKTRHSVCVIHDHISNDSHLGDLADRNSPGSCHPDWCVWPCKTSGALT